MIDLDGATDPRAVARELAKQSTAVRNSTRSRRASVGEVWNLSPSRPQRILDYVGMHQLIHGAPPSTARAIAIALRLPLEGVRLDLVELARRGELVRRADGRGYSVAHPPTLLGLIS